MLFFATAKLGWKRLAQPSHLALPALFGHSATLVNNDRGEDHVFVFGGLTPGSGDASRTESKEKTTKKVRRRDAQGPVCSFPFGHVGLSSVISRRKGEMPHTPVPPCFVFLS